MIQLFDTGEPILAQRSTVNRYIHCWNRQPGATISATDHIGHNHIGHSKTISPTAKNHIGHTENQYRPQPYRPQNIRHVYLVSS